MGKGGESFQFEGVYENGSSRTEIADLKAIAIRQASELDLDCRELVAYDHDPAPSETTTTWMASPSRWPPTVRIASSDSSIGKV